VNRKADFFTKRIDSNRFAQRVSTCELECSNPYTACHTSALLWRSDLIKKRWRHVKRPQLNLYLYRDIYACLEEVALRIQDYCNMVEWSRLNYVSRRARDLKFNLHLRDLLYSEFTTILRQVHNVPTSCRFVVDLLWTCRTVRLFYRHSD